MLNKDEIDRITSATVYAQDGDKVGGVGDLYFDDATGEPTWVTVNTGLFGLSQSFVPIREASFGEEDRLDVPYSKDQIKDAPRIDDSGHLSPEEEAELYSYYGLEYQPAAGYGEPAQDNVDDASAQPTAADQSDHQGVAAGNAGRRLRRHERREHEERGLDGDDRVADQPLDNGDQGFTDGADDRVADDRAVDDRAVDNDERTFDNDGRTAPDDHPFESRDDDSGLAARGDDPGAPVR